jgi:microcompartment protein CcmL/EutN
VHVIPRPHTEVEKILPKGSKPPVTAKAPLVAEAQAAQTDRDLTSIAEVPALAQRAKQGQPHVEVW